jgi:AbrB family looped-hinge helix DNA binding protein
MTITKLKAKNQITIPNEIVKRLHLKTGELLGIDVSGNCITLIPVEVEPRYSPEELSAIERIVEKEKNKAKILKPGKEFTRYIKRLTK